MPPPPHILLFGSTGQIGHALQRPLGRLGSVDALARADADLTDAAALRTAVREHAPDVIVNAAAYTAVDQAEEEPERAEAINATAPGVLATAAAEHGAWLVHYSTDYVFDGTQRTPYTETDPTAPLGVYGRTKRDGEAALQEAGGRHIILRTSWVYSHRRSNFLRTMLRLADTHDRLTVVNDQVGCPTWAGWIAAATAHIVETLLTRDTSAADSGLYHLSSSGHTSWYGFACAIFEQVGKDVHVEPIPTASYPTPAERPRYSVLNTSSVTQTFNLRIPTWQQQLAACAHHMDAAPGP